jgi:cytoskeletal protein CcmA (bactofilin family)
VIGDIHAQHVIVSGKLVGNIFATERVELLSKSVVEGQINYGTIGIAVGAKIQGTLNQVASNGEKPLKLISPLKKNLSSPYMQLIWVLDRLVKFEKSI